MKVRTYSDIMKAEVRGNDAPRRTAAAKVENDDGFGAKSWVRRKKSVHAFRQRRGKLARSGAATQATIPNELAITTSAVIDTGHLLPLARTGLKRTQIHPHDAEGGKRK